GDPGIGKSTLWQRTVEVGRQRSLVVLTSRPAETERELANLVLGDLFHDTPASLLASLPEPRRRALEAALLIGDPADVPVDQRALGVAVATVLRSMADQRPVLIAIDDDQWIDPSSAGTLAFALRRLHDRPIRLLLSRRARGRPPVRLEGVAESTAVARLDIGPLSVGAIQLLLRDRLGVTLSRPTLRELHRVSGGNPFHALELGRARSRDASRDLALPLSEGSVDGLLRDRIRELDAATLDASLLVAAHGRSPTELLAALDVAATTVDRAVDAGILERVGNIVAFVHPLLAAAVYDGAGTEARRAAHRRLAGAIDDDIVRARHLALGAAGPSAAMASNLDLAAETARERGQSVAAANLAERALELTPPVAADDRHRRTLAAARARVEVGDGERGHTLISGLLAEVPAGRRRAEALLLAADLQSPAKAVTMLEEALRAADSAPGLRAAIHAGLAIAGRLTHGRAWAEPHAAASLRLTVALDDDALHARALSIAAMLRFESAEPGAEELANEAHRLALRSKDVAVVREAATTIGHLLTWSGDAPQARAWLLQQLEGWRDRDEMMQSECLWYLSLVELRAGRWEAATARADEGWAIRDLYGVKVPQDHLPAALIALHRGDFELSRQHSERAMSLAKGMMLPAHLAVLATIQLWTDDPDGAIAVFDQAEAVADARGFQEPAMRWWRADYGEALLRASRIDDAERLVEDWETLAARVGRDRESAGALRVRGLIATARGDHDGAIRLLDDAAARHDAAGDRFGWARARFAAGIVHRRLRRKRLARMALEAAATAFEELGAASWVTEARAELARIGGRVRIDGMSPSEQRVAELVAEGRSNRDIAAALFLTERTVASHLTHVYAKLGVRSRTQLARIVTEEASKVPRS
ncbi:MAG: LuxR C-terminal-related transcriptional regulator, partial [Candidatus Limnocylindrales bacterium]